MWFVQAFMHNILQWMEKKTLQKWWNKSKNFEQNSEKKQKPNNLGISWSKASYNLLLMKTCLMKDQHLLVFSQHIRIIPAPEMVKISCFSLFTFVIIVGIQQLLLLMLDSSRMWTVAGSNCSALNHFRCRCLQVCRPSQPSEQVDEDQRKVEEVVCVFARLVIPGEGVMIVVPSWKSKIEIAYVSFTLTLICTF